ncbi:MAG TPA: hypothetical protein PKI11_09390 [Candidatus Hydrogenedentes bacterium]|nr:hypothetical protein [Candidatus Hydrogenedentota bacterium]HNT86684.1 hypothetical protein [Candidatus Hydrogenedentota bacterium]
MSPTVYLIIMLSVILGITAIAVPSLMWKRCPRCGRRNALEEATCRGCGAAFPDDEVE